MIRPRDIYTSLSREAMQEFIRRHQLRVVAFRTPIPGDVYITANSTPRVAQYRRDASSITFLFDRPTLRFIVKRITPPQ